MSGRRRCAVPRLLPVLEAAPFNKCTSPEHGLQAVPETTCLNRHTVVHRRATPVIRKCFAEGCSDAALIPERFFYEDLVTNVRLGRRCFVYERQF